MCLQAKLVDGATYCESQLVMKSTSVLTVSFPFTNSFTNLQETVLFTIESYVACLLTMTGAVLAKDSSVVCRCLDMPGSLCGFFALSRKVLETRQIRTHMMATVSASGTSLPASTERWGSSVVMV